MRSGDLMHHYLCARWMHDETVGEACAAVWRALVRSMKAPSTPLARPPATLPRNPSCPA